LQLSEDWVPSWISLADLEARRGQFQKAASYLNSADKSIRVLEDRQKRKPLPPFRILGLTIWQEQSNHKPNDPSLEEAERRQLLVTWLQESEQWRIDNPALLTALPATGAGPGGGGSFTVNHTNLMRRLRAAVAFERIVLKLAEGEKPALVIPLFDRVFEWDPDYFPARIEKAHQLGKLEEFREAERLLRPYIDSKDPKVSHNGRLLYEMACIYTDWYIHSAASKDADSFSRLAEASFSRLFQVNPESAEGWVKRAELYAVGGARARRRDTLRDARRWLANAREILKADTPEMQRIAHDIDQAEKEKSATRPAAAPTTRPSAQKDRP
jgi:tetratricopeptide (TPR) repeat protein